MISISLFRCRLGAETVTSADFGSLRGRTTRISDYIAKATQLLKTTHGAALRARLMRSRRSLSVWMRRIRKLHDDCVTVSMRQSLGLKHLKRSVKEDLVTQPVAATNCSPEAKTERLPSGSQSTIRAARTRLLSLRRSDPWETTKVYLLG